MSASSRILQFIDSKGISKREFYAKTGLSNGFLDKSSSPGSDNLSKIIYAYPEIDLYYIVTGNRKEGAEYADTPPVNNHFSDIDQHYEHIAHTPQKDKSLKIASPTASPTPDSEPKVIYLTPKIISVDNDANENILYVPVRASAGYLKGHSDPAYMETLPSFRLPGLDKKSYRAFQVDGDSMFPTLEDKEMVIGEWVEKLDHIREDRVHAIVTKNDGVIIKRLLNRIDKYGYVIAKSDSVNDRNLYPNIEIPPEDILEVWYAVWHGGFNFKAPGDLWKRQNNLEADLTDVLRRLKQAGI